jgi:hypothetical protein
MNSRSTDLGNPPESPVGPIEARHQAEIGTRSVHARSVHGGPIMVARATSFLPSPPRQPAAPGAVKGSVRWVLQAEGLALLTAATAAYAIQGFSWSWFALFFLAPDLTFAAYILGPRWGAAAYNAAHSTIGPLMLGGAALLLRSEPVFMAALIDLAHVGFDRMLGYGLKYGTGFGDTHLGRKGP